MIKLSQLIFENCSNRVNLTKLVTVVHKLHEELGEDKCKQVMDILKELTELTVDMNSKPYKTTEKSLMEWSMVEAILKQKLMELQEQILKLSENNAEVNFLPALGIVSELINN